MKMHEPVGNALWGPLIMRVPLGLYFLLAGFAKLQAPVAFVKEVQSFGILNEHLSTLYGMLLPYFEIVSGVLLIFGVWTTLACILTSLMLISFIIALGLFPKPHQPFNKDIILLGVSIALMYTGGGAISVDRFRKLG